MRTYTLTRDEAKLAFDQVQSHTQALKNWIASAVEAMQWDRAADLVRELRKYEALYAKLNVEAHEYIDRSKS